jgi:hypothetical protein
MFTPTSRNFIYFIQVSIACLALAIHCTAQETRNDAWLHNHHLPGRVAPKGTTAGTSDFVSAIQYGADPTGTTDSSAAINAAIAANPTSVIYLPPQTSGAPSVYKINSASINVNSAVGLLICGTVTGSANPLMSISSNNVSVQGCTAGAALEPTGTNGALYAGHPSAPNAAYLLQLTLRNLTISAPAKSSPAYGVYLQNATAFELDGVNVFGNNLMTTGYRLEGAEQGEIHGGAVSGAVTNVDWEEFTYGGTARQASGNGVHVHGMTFQNSATNGKNMLFGVSCCDDAEITENHFIISQGALYNVDVESDAVNSGPIVIANNHIENGTLTNPTAAWAIKVNNGMGVVIKGNQIDCGPSPYNLIWVTGNSTETRIVDGNSLSGLIQIDSSVRDTTITHNIASNVSLVDNGVDTIRLDNRDNSNIADIFVASGYLSTDIATFAPKSNNPGSTPSGSSWGLNIKGNTASSSNDTYVRFNSGPIISGNSNNQILFKSGVGGNLWFYFDPVTGFNNSRNTFDVLPNGIVSGLHFKGSSAAPQTTSQSALGTSGTVTVAGNDQFFQITAKAGSSGVTGQSVFNVVFASSWTSSTGPYCIAGAANAAAAAYPLFTGTGTSTSMSFLTTNPLAAGVTYKWNIHCGE